MEVLRVKYCYSESNLNLFLETLNVGPNASLPKLHSIQYLPQAYGNGTNENIEMHSEVIAIVQYFTEVY
jgi:hypothetical protein